MDLISTFTALWRLLGGRREEHLAQREPDPAEMGTAYGMEASLAPENWSEPSTLTRSGWTTLTHKRAKGRKRRPPGRSPSEPGVSP